MERKNLVILSGSGISVESGMSTFRGGDGLWDNYSIDEICTPQGWYADKEKVLGFYNGLRAKLEHIKPNEAHIIIKELEEYFNVSVITQNVDNLHEQAGSVSVLHLHGELTKVRPEDCCTAYDGYSLEHVRDIGYAPVHPGEKGGPHNTQLRPHIVWFGEAVPNLDKAAKLVGQADILLVIGTSMSVYPAASLHHYAPRGCRKYLIDPDDSPAGSFSNITHIKDVATSGMRKFRKMILEND